MFEGEGGRKMRRGSGLKHEDKRDLGRGREWGGIRKMSRRVEQRERVRECVMPGCC